MAANAAEITTSLNHLRDGVNAAGAGAAAFARGDALGALRAGVVGTAQVLERVPVVGKPAAAALGVLAAGAERANETMQAFVERGRQLQMYSGELASANAQATVRRIQTDIKDADRLGKSLGRITDNMSRLEASVRDSVRPVEERATVVGEMASNAFNFGWQFGVKPQLDLFTRTLSAQFDAATFVARMQLDALGKITALVQDGRQKPGEVKFNRLMQELLDSADDLSWEPGAGNAAADREADRPLKVPILGLD